MPDLTPYEIECRKRCEWCAKGWRRYTFGGNATYWHLNMNGGTPPVCAAPDRDTFEAELMAQLAEAKRDTERLDNILRNWEMDFHYPDDGEPGYWRICRRLGNTNDREWVEIGRGETLRGALDDAREGEKHG